MTIEPLGPSQDVRTLVFSFDDKYAKYFSVALASLAAHARPDLRYDIVVLHEQVSEQNMQLLQSMVPGSFTLRFFDVGDCARELLGGLDKRTSGNRWDASTFFDLLVPLLMPGYDRVLYCDSDLVFADGFDELFTTPFDGAQLIAVRDTLCFSPLLLHDNAFLSNQLRIVRDDLGVTDLGSYFNGGVLAFNIPAIQRDAYLQLVRRALDLPELPTVDQDALNLVFCNRVKIVPQRFNLQVHLLEMARGGSDDAMVREYLAAAKAPVIVHYTTEDKPWANPACEMGDLFWGHARTSPFCDEIKPTASRGQAQVDGSEVRR